MTAKAVTQEDKNIGLRVRARRIEKKMSQTQLGDELGVTFQQIQKYERGANRIGAGRLTEVAKALDVPLPYLYGMDAAVPGSDTTSILALMADKNGQRLIAAFRRIDAKDQQAALIAIVETVADASDAIRNRTEKRFVPAGKQRR